MKEDSNLEEMYGSGPQVPSLGYMEYTDEDELEVLLNEAEWYVEDKPGCQFKDCCHDSEYSSKVTVRRSSCPAYCLVRDITCEERTGLCW